MLFKAAERKTSRGMARLLQDKGPQGKDEVWISASEFGMEEGAAEMVLQVTASQGRRAGNPSPAHSCQQGLDSAAREAEQGLKCTIPVKVQCRGWRQQSSKQLPTVPVVQAPEKASAVRSKFFLSLRGKKKQQLKLEKEENLFSRPGEA